METGNNGPGLKNIDEKESNKPFIIKYNPITGTGLLPKQKIRLGAANIFMKASLLQIHNMKLTFKIFAAFCIITLVACNKKASDALLVNFINRSGVDLRNLTIDSLPVGTLPNNAETGFIRLNSFNTQSDLPFFDIKGESGSRVLQGLSQFPGCGNERKTVYKGKYTVEIGFAQMDTVNYLSLTFR